MSGKVVMGVRGVVAAEHPIASLLGFESMKRGGNAFDAAATTSFALGVLQPQLNGLGGDFFGLFYHASERKYYCLNASGWSSSEATPEAFSGKGNRVPLLGPGSVVVPGYVKGVYAMQRKFGTQDFKECVTPSVRLAEQGFAAGNGLVRAVSLIRQGMSEEAMKTFLREGTVPPAGTLLRQPELAKSLSAISESGPDAFYHGEPARAIADAVTRGGYWMNADDFARYEPEWCEPLKMSYSGTEVLEVPPNSMGATALLILKLLEEQHLGSVKPNSERRVELMVEAARLAYAARDRELGDPRFAPFDLGKFLRSSGPIGGQKRIDDADTTYFAVADEEGNILSCIQSLFHFFGSRVFVGPCGFFLNNRGSAFRMDGPNGLEPRKRPLHTLSALILARDGKPFMAAGASGGEYRPQQHALMVSNVVDYGMGLEEAIDYPRFLWDGSGGLKIEAGFQPASVRGLKTESLPYPGGTGVAQGVQLSQESMKGVCDIRGEGLPSGA
jgi:gamma-glutamyltranspeptidase / glutathione hydrolase